MFIFLLCCVIAVIIAFTNHYQSEVNYRDKYYLPIWFLSVVVFFLGVWSL